MNRRTFLAGAGLSAVAALGSGVFIDGDLRPAAQTSVHPETLLIVDASDWLQIDSASSTVPHYLCILNESTADQLICYSELTTPEQEFLTETDFASEYLLVVEQSLPYGVELAHASTSDTDPITVQIIEQDLRDSDQYYPTVMWDNSLVLRIDDSVLPDDLSFNVTLQTIDDDIVSVSQHPVSA